MITHYTYDSGVDGVHVLIAGAVHGDEKCGSRAIQQIMDELDRGDISLLSGKITFVPIVNQKAYAQNVRYTEENLNRVVMRTTSPASYEQEIANDLCDLIDSCDAMLDLHSFSAEGGPFAFLDYPSESNSALVQSLGAPYVIEGWPSMYESDPVAQSYDTERYAHTMEKMCVTLECGSHEDEESVFVAYRAIKSVLRHFDLIETVAEVPSESMHIIIREVFLRRGDSDTLSKRWQNFDPILKGELIATATDGSEFRSSMDGHIVMPVENGVAGEELFYLGVLKE